jgi:hypothetical protein
VPASAIDTGALAKAFQYELIQKLAADGLSAQVSVEATNLSGRRRRLHQAGTAQIKYTIVVMVPVGSDASNVRGCSFGLDGWCCTYCRRPMPARPASWVMNSHDVASLLSGSELRQTACLLKLPQVTTIAKAAAKAVATDKAILRRLLQLCLPADLFSSLNIDALIDAMIKTTVVDADVSGGSPPGSQTPRGASRATPPGSKTPPGSYGSPAAAKTASVKVTQTIPGVSASQVCHVTEVWLCPARTRGTHGSP